MLVASVQTVCGEFKYLTEEGNLSKGEIEDMRAILSSLFDKGNVIFSWPGKTAETLTDQERQKIIESLKASYNPDFVNGLNQAQLEDMIRKFANNPEMRIHIPPSAKSIREMLDKKAFRLRAGEKLVGLLNRRLEGQRGSGEEIEKQLHEKFGVTVDRSNLNTDENCHVAGSLGTFY